jgi:hypothetical protein
MNHAGGIVEKRMRPERRQQTIKSILYDGFLHKRRRTNRRDLDDQTIVLDWYDPSLFIIAMGIVSMSCLDAIFTLKLLSLGGEEINWFMRSLLEQDVRLFLLVKYTITASGVVFLVALSRMSLLKVLRVRNVLGIMCAIYASLIFYELYLLVAIATGQLA